MYSNLKSGMRFESPTKPKSLEPAFEVEESVGEERERQAYANQPSQSLSSLHLKLRRA
jgi:hypothetical protein